MLLKKKLNRNFLLVLILFVFSVNYTFSQSSPTITVKQNLPIGSSASLCGVAYGNGKYVTAGSYSPNPGLIYVSEDTKNWLKVNDADIPATSTFRGVAYGNGIFVLVGEGGLILSSTDGLDWTQRTSGVTANFNKLLFVEGKFYAVGASRTLLSSTDGINWSQISFNVGSGSDDLINITYGSSTFVIGTRGVNNSGTHIYKSGSATSGSWSYQTVSSTYDINRVQYLKDKFYIFTAQSEIFTSTNASTWVNSTSSMVATLPDLTTQNLGTPNQLFHGIYDGTKIYLFGSSKYHGGYGSVFSSSNGTDFTLHNRTTSIVAQHSDYVNGNYIQTGNEGLCTSTDGINYVYPGGSYSGITTDGTNIVIVGNTGSSEAVMVSSTDFDTLSNNTQAIYSSLQGVSYVNNRFIAVGSSGIILSSTDGISWTKQTSVDSDALKNVAYGNGKYVAVGVQGKIIYSSDGASWSQVKKDNSSGSNFNSVRYLNGYFIAVGGSAASTGTARIAYSTDGQNWTEITPGITGHFHDITYDGSKYLLVGRLNSDTASAREFFSTTTTNITSNTFTGNVTLPTTNTGGVKLGASGFGCVIYSDGYFVAATNQTESPFAPYILESSDGTSWTPYSINTTSRLRSITAIGSNFYIAGTSSTLVKFSYASAAVTTVTTASASSISASSATLGGNVTTSGGSAVTERGIVWSTSISPTTANHKVAIGTGTGSFSQTISGFPSNTTIYVRAYAIDGSNTTYGGEISFTTPVASTLLFMATNDGINYYSEFYGYNSTKGAAQIALDINAFGNDAIIGRGYVWNNKLFASFQNLNGSAQFGYYDGTNFVAIGNLDPYISPGINTYAEYNGDLYFEAGENSSYHLWRYDPDTNTLTKISTSLGRTFGYGLAVYHGKLYFSASTSTSIHSLTTLYTWDGSSINAVSNFSNVAANPYRFFAYNDYLYMAANPSGQSLNTELYRYTDAGLGTTSLVADLNTTGNNNSSSTLSDFTLFDGKLFFTTAANYTEGRVYSVNTSNTLTIEYDPPLSSNSNQPSNLVVLNNVLYFMSPYTTTKMELMRYNSTNNVTVLTNHTATNKTIFSLVASQSDIYFVRSESNFEDKEIFKYDIGSQTVTQITDINTTGNGSSIDGHMYVLPVETAPAVYGGANVLMHKIGSSISTINSSIKVADVEVTTITGGYVSISTGFENGDQLNFTNQNGISGTYDNSTGVLTLTGDATINAYETALSTISFSTSSTTAGDRIISFQVSDGSKYSSLTAKASQTTIRVYTGDLIAFNFDSAPSGVPALSSSPSSYADGFSLTDATLGIVDFKTTDDGLTTSFASLTPTSGAGHGIGWNDAQYGGINSLSIVSDYTSPNYLVFKTASGKKFNFESFTYWDDGSFYGGGPYFGNIYVVGYKNGVQVAEAKLPVHLRSPKPILLNANFKDLDEVRLRVYDPADPDFLNTPVFGVFDNFVFTEATAAVLPIISSAVYDASTGILSVSGTNLVGTNGASNDIIVNKLTLKGEGSNTHTLTSADVEIISATSFEITLNATDKAAVNLILNKIGTISTGGTTYNLAAADGWLGAISGNADLTGNAVTVSNVPLPIISSATYDATTGNLVVSGTGFLVADGANNDIDVGKLKIRGEGNSTYTLTSANIDITNGTTFTINLNSTDITALSAILNKEGTVSVDNTTYNLEASDDWNTGADATLDIKDLLNNGITVSNIPASLATLTTESATNILPNSATLGGNITANGGATVTERGIVWSTNTNPTISDNKVNIGSGTGTFSQSITGLPEGTIIYVRSYAINSVGTAYGNEISFSTCPSAPVITSPASLVVCSPATLTLTASGCVGTVKWSDNSTGTAITLSGVGTYSLSATCIVNGCTSNASTIVTGLEIRNNTVPSISINPLMICAGANQVLTALPVNEGLIPKYFWYKNNVVQYVSDFINKTTSNGLAGNIVYDVFFDNNNKIYVATSTGLSISSDGGNTFINKTTANGLGSNIVRGVHATNDGKVYAATLSGLSISTDGGNTFINKTTSSGLGDNNLYEIFVAANGNIYGATNGGLSISTDGGTSFVNKTTTNGLGNNVVFGIVVGDDNKIYVATNAGLSISSDGGNTFTNKTTTAGLGHNTVRGVYLGADNKLYAATSGGLSISTDEGNTFVNKNTSNGLTVNSIFGVTAGADGRIYAATQGGGVGVSSDGGNSFVNKTTSDGIGNNNVWKVFIGPDNKLYSATLGGGLSIANIINGVTYTANGISASDTYKVVLFPSSEMCSTPASVEANISASSTPAPTLNAPANTSVYWPNTLTLTASGCAGSITWSNSATGTSLTLTAIGTYAISATCTTNGCTSSASTVITGLEIKPSINPVIGTPVLSASSICAGSSLNITFEVSGTFGAGNQFSVLLSDTTGSFTNATTIGTSTSAGTITYNVPVSVKGSNAYKVKIVSGNPIVQSVEVSLSIHGNNKILSTTETLTGNNTIKAVNSIQASNKFITPTNTLYKAGNFIILTPGFETTGVFTAEIGSCSQ